MIEKLFDRLLGFIKQLKYAYLRIRIKGRIARAGNGNNPKSQALEVYSSEDFFESVSAWGEQSAWKEVLLLLAGCQGKILDIACGPGTLYSPIKQLSGCDYYGCDISSFLIGKAVEFGVPREKLKVCDATKSGYEDQQFDYAFSIGSLEHFTEVGIFQMLNECKRITKKASFHQIPTARNGNNEGWIQLDQSYFNNSVDWWLDKFKQVYERVIVLDSQWEDPISLGKWFVCWNEAL